MIIVGTISAVESDGYRVFFPQLDNFVTGPLKKSTTDTLAAGDGVEVHFLDADYASGYISAKLPD